VTVAELDAAPPSVASRALQQCCGSARWVAAMLARRPFAHDDAVLRAAEECWWALGTSDWLEAFSHHPRIGDRAAGWAADEQAGVRGASDDTTRQLATLNRQYERKFGHVFLIFASGKDAGTMLAELQRRITSDPAAELRTAAAEQAKITDLRLRRLLASSTAGAP
jgi:2-oxo-4-hydroxy-4-carboxy-5-ureidoimidazoline decarboxylase